MRIKFVLLALKYPGLKLLILRRTLPELRENHIIPLMGMLQGLAKYSADEKAFRFPNGSRIKLGYCDSESDVFQYQGQEYDVIGFEEATHFTEEQKDFITTCNRSVRSDFTPRIYYTANPGGPGMAWFKRLFIDKEYRGSEKAEDYTFIPANIFDNEILMKQNPEYLRILENLPEDLKRAHLYGDWDAFAGQVFNEFRRDIHVIKPFEIPKEWMRIRSMDWGFSKPYAIYWGAVDHDGVIYIYRELYGCKSGYKNVGTQETAREVAHKVKDLESGERIDNAVADPACWSKAGHDGPTIAETFIQEGVYWNKADNDRLQGKMQVHHRLRGYGPDKPGIKMFETCTHLIRTLPALQYDKHKCEDVDTTQEDHNYDSIKYMLLARPWANEKPKVIPLIDRYNYEPEATDWMSI